MDSQDVEKHLLPTDMNQIFSKSGELFPANSEQINLNHTLSDVECKSEPSGKCDTAGSESYSKDTKSNFLADDNDRHLQDSVSTRTVQRECSPERSYSNNTFHTLCGFYAQITVVVASIFVFTEVINGPIPLLFFHGYLFTYLLGGSIICFIGIYVVMLVDKCPKLMDKRYSDDINKSKFSTSFIKNLFSSHSNIYMKTGVAVFGSATLISNGLEIASIFNMPHNCMDELNLAQPILRGLFSFFQMHFLFMNVQSIINALGWFRHVALMHLVATNITIWIQLVLWECAKAWLEATHTKHNSSVEFPGRHFNFIVHTFDSDINSPDVKYHKPYHKVRFTTNCWWRYPDEEKTEDLIMLQMCLQNSTIGSLWEKSMSYLYPFIIQYCLVSAVIIYIIWSNLYYQHFKLKYLTCESVNNFYSANNQITCSESVKGLILGLLVLVSGMIALILFFISNEGKDFNELFIIESLRVSILGISTVAAAVGLFQIRKIKSKTRQYKKITDLLQQIGMLAICIYGSCSMIVGGISISNLQHLLLFVDGKLMIIQACLQSVFIHQISEKRLKSLNEKGKLGRQVSIFLVFSNIVLWLFQSFTTQNQISSQLQLKFYGNIIWSFINKIILPLVIFYRFHSVVALMDMWQKS